jgi:hypothetical protein
VLGRLTQRRELNEQVAQDLARRGLELLRVAVWSSPVAFLLLSFVLHRSVGTRNVTLWLVAMASATVVNLLLIQSSHAKAPDIVRRNGVVIALCCGSVWGATPHLLDPVDPLLKLLTVSILIAVSAVASVMMATERVVLVHAGSDRPVGVSVFVDKQRTTAAPDCTSRRFAGVVYGRRPRSDPQSNR